MNPILLSLCAVLINLPGNLANFKHPNSCTDVWNGCDLVGGKCRCINGIAACFNPFRYKTQDDCLLQLYQDSDVDDYPLCNSATVYPICNKSYEGLKYCHGSCNSHCCIVREGGCLPPVNIYVPAASCLATLNHNACEDYDCAPGYKCVPTTSTCRLVPCYRTPSCVVDEGYDACKYARCGYNKECIRVRSRCSDRKCPYTFKCTSKRVYKLGLRCPACPSLSFQQSYCRSDFAIRARVRDRLWTERYFKKFGICDWYNITVEYILEQKNSELDISRNAILLVKSRPSCSCNRKIKPHQRYGIVGEILDISFDEQFPVIYVPNHGQLRPWTQIKKRKDVLGLKNDKCGIPFTFH